jgi:hypothetical protein
MPKAKRTEATVGEKIPRWELQVDYVETCNCDFACPCNFSGYPTGGLCEALVGYHIKKGRFGKTRLDGLDVIYAAAWPKAIHQGNGTLRLYISEGASPEARDALIRVFSGKAKGNGPFELFGGTMTTFEEPVFAPVAMTIDGRRSAFRVPGHIEVALAPHTNPVSGEVQGGHPGEHAEGLHLPQRARRAHAGDEAVRRRHAQLRPLGTERVLRAPRVRRAVKHPSGRGAPVGPRSTTRSSARVLPRGHCPRRSCPRGGSCSRRTGLAQPARGVS